METITRRRVSFSMRLLMAGLMTLFCSCGHKQKKGELNERFQAELEKLHDEYGFPGATAAYILPDGTTGIAVTGLADVENNIPMTPDSRMLAASIGKTFVGATVLALANESALNIDDPVSKWLGDLPWFPRLPNHQHITVHHILTHTSGIANHVEMEGFIEAFRRNRGIETSPLTPESMIGHVLDQAPLCGAGEGWYYSDTGYLLAGLIIETITGHSYYEEVGRRFLAPLGLTRTSPSDRAALGDLASGYVSPENLFDLPPKTTGRPGVMCWNPAIEWTGGGLVTNPRDLVVWAKALYEGKAMEGEYMRQLLDSVPVGDNSTGIRYGMAVAIHNDGPFGQTYGHSGWIPGYCSSLRYYSAYGIAVAFQLNTDIGIIGGTNHVFEDLEKRLAGVVISTEGKN